MTPRAVRQRLWLWAPALAYMSVIYYLSSQPDPLPAVTSTVWDKALHFIEYSGLSFLLIRALSGEGLERTTAAILAVVATSLYGVSDEWHQLFTPGRSSDVLDWLTDTIGGGIGVAAYLVAIAFSTALRPPRQPQR